MTKFLSAVKKGLKSYYDKVQNRSDYWMPIKMRRNLYN